MRKMQPIDRGRYQMLRKMLEDRGREIAEKMRSLRESLPDDLAAVKDAEEQSVDEFVRGFDYALIEMKSHTLARIDEAVQRLEEGRYGVCVDCQQTIGAPRLRALPFVERCRECQEGREETAAKMPHQQPRFGLGGTAKAGEAPPAAPAHRPGRRAPELAETRLRRSPVPVGSISGEWRLWTRGAASSRSPGPRRRGRLARLQRLRSAARTFRKHA